MTDRALTRALFISGSLGKGHDVLAEACAGALEAHGVECEIVDAMRLLGSGPGAVGDWVFRRLLSVNVLYDAFHLSQLRGDGRLARVMDRLAVDVMFPHLRETVERFRPELVVSVFATGAGGAARLKAAGCPVTSVVAMTDSFAHRFWVHESTDLFLVTSPAAVESVRRYWPEATVEVITAPVRSEFYTAPSQAVAREHLGIPSDVTCVLLMSGAWGLGPLAATAAALASSGIWVLAVAGTNASMERKLQELARHVPGVIPFGYTDRVPELMAASDVVVTSSGDTCREARTLGRGIILLDVVPGHGRENLIHELELGGATVCMPTPESIARAVRSFVADPSRMSMAPVALLPAGPPDASDPVPASPAGPPDASDPVPASPAGPPDASDPVPASPAGPPDASDPVPASPAPSAADGSPPSPPGTAEFLAALRRLGFEF